MNILLLGAQGSGKGTQAKLIADKYRWPHVSTGDIFRDNIKRGTELGKKARAFIDKGALVPDDLTISLIKDRLSQKDCKKGYVIDGFPRNIAQAKALDKIAKIEIALEIFISDKEAIKRISGRRTCSKCGQIYSVYEGNEELCKKCGGLLMIRDDDKPHAVHKRLEIYHQQTEPLIEFYSQKKVMKKIDGERPIKEIFEDIKKILG